MILAVKSGSILGAAILKIPCALWEITEISTNQRRRGDRHSDQNKPLPRA